MSLEEKVNDKESKGFIKKAAKIVWKLGMATATTALSVSLVGTSGILVGGGFAVGGAIANLARGKSLYDSVSKALTTYSAVNAIIYPMVALGNATFPLIANDTFLGQAARGIYASTLYNAAFVGLFRGASHLVDNYLSPVGITKSVSEGFLEDWAKIGLLFSPFYALDANGISKLNVFGATLPTFAVGALPVGFALNYFFSKDKPKYNPSYTPRITPAPAYAGATAH